jgi:hypothetical protein
VGERLDDARLSGPRLTEQLDVQVDTRLLDGALLDDALLDDALLDDALLDGALLDDRVLLATVLLMAHWLKRSDRTQLDDARCSDT